MNHTHTFQSQANTPEPMPDDVLVTAYALGELEGEPARAIEARAATDNALRREIEMIRATAGMLRAGYAAEPVAVLTEAQRQRILRQDVAAQATERASLNAPSVFRPRWVGASLAAAAAIALTLTAAIVFRQAANSRGVAHNSPSEMATNESLRQGAVDASRDAFAEGGRHDDRSSAPSDTRRNESLALSDELDAGIRERASVGGLRAGNDGRGKDENGMLGVSAASTAVAPAPAPGAAAAPRQAGGEPAIATGAAGVGGGGRGASGNRGDAAASESETDPAPPRGSVASPKPADPPPSSQPPAPAAREPAVVIPVPEAAPASDPQTRTQPAGGSARTAESDTRANESQRARGSDNVILLEQAERYRFLTADEIAAMTEPQITAALGRINSARTARLSPEEAQALRQEFEGLMTRLRDLRAQAAAEAEEYARINDNPFIKPVGAAALSTFAADVDTASYSNIRRFLNEGRLPPADAVRIEEMINYFRYDYEPPTGDAAFSANIEVAPAPWNPEHRLVRIGLRGKEVRMDMRQATSLVFLIDVSASMRPANKLPLVKDSLKQLLRQLHGDDRLAIVTYAGNAGVALDSCYVNAENREAIDAAIDNLQAGGSTNGAGGIAVAYDLARQHFIQGGINRVILCTDGDFNVGVSGDDALVQLIEEQRESGVFLTVLGFGTGNFKDAKMEKVADAGNGNFAYIDSINEARKVLVEQMGGTLVTIAKDVKFQVEFNPAKVGAYRLIGYENRLLAAEDFNNDLKDAGEIGSGHTMTALYEVVPPGKEADALALNQPEGAVDELEFQKPAAPASDVMKHSPSEDLLILKMRAKAPEAAESTLTKIPVADKGRTLDQASADFRFAAAVAEFGMLLRRSPYRGAASFAGVLDHAEEALGGDPEGYRLQFIELVRKAQALERGEP